MNSGKKLLSFVLLAVALVLVNYLALSLSTRADLTAEQSYTLSDGTKNLLKKLDEPVTLKLYFSRSLKNLPIWFKNYATRVEELLRQYQSASGGKVKLVVIDPKPDSKEEEAATKAGITGEPLGDLGSLYFGLVAELADQQKNIPLLTPNREQFLEYDISQLIFTVQQVVKPKLGLLSSLPLQGGGMTMAMGGMPQQQPGQVVAEEWARTYEIVEIQPTADELPAGLDVLAVIHPQNLSDKLQFAIDQFVLGGKPVLVALDASSVHFRSQSRQMGMMGGQPPQNVTSNLPRLLSAWGVTFDPNQVVGDFELASMVRAQRGTTSMPSWLTLRPANVAASFVPTSAVKTLNFIDAGAFTVAKTEGVEFTPVIETTTQSGFVPGMMLQFEQADLAKTLKATGDKKILAGLLRGTFKTAFPDGAPKAAAADKKDGDKPAEPAKPAAPALAKSEKPGTVFLVADTDWLLDNFSLRKIAFLGQQAIQPLNDNLTLGSSLLEFLGGSTDLISIRGKGSAQRPFEVIRKMEVEAQAQYQAQLQALEDKLQGVQKKLNELVQSQKDKSVLIATPEMQAEIERFRTEEAKMKSERREIRAALRTDIESLQNKLIALNLLAVPVLVALFGWWFFHRRNTRPRAA